jgi:hypothetical protein
MLLKFGGFSHAVAEVDVAMTAETIFTDDGTPWATDKRWTITGDILGGSAAEIDTAVTLLIDAYEAGTTGDLILTLPSGASAYAVSALAGDALGGQLVVTRPPSFPTMANAGYVTTLPFSIEVGGRFPLSDVSVALRSFSESLTFSGGGPQFAHLELITGRPRAQRVRDSTIYRATQAGQAVGIYRYPQRPSPIWPQAQVVSPVRQVDSPSRIGGVYTDFPISWSYEFESAYPLFGTPNPWGLG